MTRYRVNLEYPKASRLPVFCEDIDAASQSQAIAIVKLNAKREGWHIEPKSARAQVLRGELA
ncbi:hypothetical protein D3C81_2295160 [compost metagenome]